jgi:hypothetical protein
MKQLLFIFALLLSFQACTAQLIDLQPNKPDEIPNEFWRQLPRDVRQDVKAEYKEERKKERDEDAYQIPPGESVQIPFTPAIAKALGTEANWGREYMKMPAVVDAFLGKISNNKPLLIGLLDTGEPDHNSLTPYLLKQYGKSYTGEPIVDGHNHATHIAGTYFGETSSKTFGVLAEAAEAGKVKMVAYKVCTNAGSCPNSYIAQSIRDFVDDTKGLGYNRLLSVSLGGSAENSQIKSAMKYAADNNVLIVAAAGNNGRTPLAYPGRDDNAVGVGAFDRNGKRASFSQYGQELMFSAPGVLIPSTCKGNTECLMSGTSMATPHQGAGMGAAWLMYPNLTAEQLINYCASNATDAGEAGWDKFYGYGWISVQHMLNNPPSGDEEPDEPEDPDEGEEDGVVFPERSMTFTLKGEWPILYTEVQTANEQQEAVLLNVNDAQAIARTWNVLTVTEIVVELNTTDDAKTARKKLQANTDGYFRNRGVGLGAPADHFDALVWSLYFFDLITDRRAEIKQDINVIAARGHSADGYSVSVVDLYEQTKKWPRNTSAERRPPEPEFPAWMITAAFDHPRTAKNAGFPDVDYQDLAVYTVSVPSKEYPTRLQIEQAAHLPGAKLVRTIKVVPPIEYDKEE